MSLSVKAEDMTQHQECKITSDYEILRKSPLFKGADPEVTKLFAYLAKRKTYSPGELIITAGKNADSALYIVSGQAEVTTLHRKKEVLLQRLKPETLCGELALLAEFKWFFTVRTTEECEVVILSRESFQKVLHSFPDKRDDMIAVIIQLRVKRLIEQTDFMLDNLPQAYLKQSIWSPSQTPL